MDQQLINIKQGDNMADLNIYQRLSKISEEAENIPKNGYNKFSNYKYIMAIDVIGHIKKLMIKHGVYLSVDEVDVKREHHGKNFHSTIKCEGVFFNIDDPSDVHNVSYCSVSADTLDKDIFKAKTNGLKYLLTQQFMLVSDDFIDTENDSKQSGKVHSKSNEINKSNPPDADVITDVQYSSLFDLCNKYGYNASTYLKGMARQEYKIDNIINLPRGKYDEAAGRIEAQAKSEGKIK